LNTISATQPCTFSCRSWTVLSRNALGTCTRRTPCAALFVWIISCECRRPKEFTNPRVNLILNWNVQWSMITSLVTGVSSSTFCGIQSRSCLSQSWSRAICFPRWPGSSSQCPKPLPTLVPRRAHQNEKTDQFIHIASESPRAARNSFTSHSRLHRSIVYLIIVQRME
jgi:hypothetical protein